MLVLDLSVSPQAVLEFSLGWDDPHQLQHVVSGHDYDNLLGGKKGCMTLPEFS